MASPQMPRDELDRWMREIESRVAQVEKRDPLINSGLSVTAPGTMTVNGNLTVTGSLASSNYAPGSAGYQLNGTQVEIDTGAIGTSALVHPVGGQSAEASTTGFGLSTSLTELAGIDVLVPQGFTQAVGTMGSYVFSYNPNTTGGSNGAGGDAVYAQARFGTKYSKANPLGDTGNGGYATASSGAAFNFTGLTAGSTLHLAVLGASAYQPIAANTNNYANVFAAITWLA